MLVEFYVSYKFISKVGQIVLDKVEEVIYFFGLIV